MQGLFLLFRGIKAEGGIETDSGLGNSLIFTSDGIIRRIKRLTRKIERLMCKIKRLSP